MIARLVAPLLALSLACAGCGSSSKSSSSSGTPQGQGGGAGQTGGGGSGPGGGAQGGSGPGSITPSPLGSVPGHDPVLQDTSPKEAPRMVPPEVYIRSMLHIFGDLAPPDLQAKFKAANGSLFDTWNDYLSALGLPDLRIDVPRAPQSNALMVATFERVGIALCDLAVKNDLHNDAPPPVDKRVVFAFDVPKGDVDEAAFTPRFDVLHRTFLGYPEKLSPVAGRRARFLQLYHTVYQAHLAKDAPKGFTPEEAGWAAVCYGLARHPEFHLY